MADADDDWSDLEAADEPVGHPNSSERESSRPGASAGGGRAPGKRRGRHNDDDFESQQSILKWVRQVPGPLQDVMKKQVDQLDGDNLSHQMSAFASGNSDRYSIAVSTVFDDGAWVDMCSFLGMETTPGRVYGGIKVSRLKHTVVEILDDDKMSPKIPQLLLLIKSARYVDEEIVAVFHDPTGEIDGYFHREIVEQIGPALIEGVGILLRNVSVFLPVSNRGECYLNVVPRSLQRVFLPNSHAVSSFEVAVQEFNAARELEVEEETVAEEVESVVEPPQTHMLQHDTVRHTSTELSYLSQRQVVHRHPPVNSTVASIMSGKNSDANGGDEEPEATGLGRWQWNRLAQKNASKATASSSSGPDVQGLSEGADELGESSTPAPSSRMARLLATKRARSSGSRMANNKSNEADRRDVELDGDFDESPQQRPKKRTPTQVTFAPDVVATSLDAETSKSRAENVSGAHTTSVPPAESREERKPAAIIAGEEEEEEEEEEEDAEDDDDDW